MAGPYDDLMTYAAPAASPFARYVAPDPQDAPGDEPSWIKALANKAIFAPLQWIGESLGKPQQALYGLLDGDVSALANLIPFSDTLGITGHNPGEGLINTPRRSGQEMLQKWGVIDNQDSWGNWAAGLGLDLVADPMAFLSFGKGALTAAGQAAEKGGTLERSLLGRVTAAGGPQGGLVGVHAPWYATLTGLADKTPWATLGTGGVGQYVGQKAQDLGEAALRWTVPGTDWSPLAAFNSTFRPYRGITGTPEYVSTAGKQLEADTLAMQAAGRGRQMPFALDQSNALNALQATGMAPEDAGYALWRAGLSQSTSGEALMTPGLSQAQEQVVRDFAAKAAASRPAAYDAEAAIYRGTGGALKDVTTPWQDYEHLQGAGYANRLRGPEMERSDLAKYFAYGPARLDELARDPGIAGIAATKQAGVPFNQAAVDAQIAGNAAQIAQVMSGDIQQRFGHLLGAAGQPVGPLAPEMLDLLQYADVNKALKPAGEIADYLAKRPAGALYKPDLAAARLAYAEGRAKLGAGNLTALQTLANEASPLQGALTAATDTRDVVKLTDALKEVGLADTAIPELQRRLTTLGKAGPLDELAADADLVKFLKKEVQGPKATPPGPLSKLASWFRYGVTVPFPANLTRNWADTLLQEGLSGSSASKNLGTAVDYFRKAVTDPAELAKAQKAFEAGFQHGLFDDQLRGLWGVDGLTKGGERALNLAPTQVAKGRLTSLAEQFGGIKDAALNTPGVVGKVTGPVREYLTAMEGAHGFQNNVTRLQQMMNLLDEGWSPSAAAEKVKVSQLDYNRLSQTMREQGRAVVPFANFSLQNLRRTGDLLQNNPGGLSGLLALANSGRGGGDYVPPYVSGGAAIPVGGAEDGKQRFLSSFGIPMEDEAVGAVAALLAGRPFEAARRVGSSVSPALKVPAEVATGTQIFSGRPLEDLKPSGTLAALLGDNPFSRGLSEVVQGTPGARVLSTSDRLLDSPNKGVLASLLNLGTGLRVTDVDQQQATEIAARDALKELLKSSRQFKSRESVYLDKSKVPDPSQLPPELQALLAQYQAIEKRSQAAAKAAKPQMVP